MEDWIQVHAGASATTAITASKNVLFNYAGRGNTLLYSSVSLNGG